MLGAALDQHGQYMYCYRLCIHYTTVSVKHLTDALCRVSSILSSICQAAQSICQALDRNGGVYTTYYTIHSANPTRHWDIFALHNEGHLVAYFLLIAA